MSHDGHRHHPITLEEPALACDVQDVERPGNGLTESPARYGHRCGRVFAFLGCLATVVLLCATSNARPKLRIDARLSQRFNLTLNMPQTKLSYLGLERGWDRRDYLSAQSADPSYSVFAAARLSFDMTRQFQIVFDLDSGDLRPHSRRIVRRPVTLADRTGATTVAEPYGGRYGLGPTSNGRSLLAEAQASFFLRELYVRFAEDNEFLFKMGRGRLLIGDGLIHDGSALLLTLGGGDRWLWLEGTVAVSAPDMRQGIDSPLLLFSAIGYPSRKLRFALHAAYVHDGGDLYAGRLGRWFDEGALIGGPSVGGPDNEALRDRGWAHVLGTPKESWGNLGFAGAEVEWSPLRILTLRSQFWIQAGEVGIDSQAGAGERYDLSLPGPQDGDWTMLSLGGAGLVSILMTFGEVEIDLWGMFMTGDQHPMSSDASATKDPVFGFHGIRPRLTQTNLFLSGGMDETLTFRGHDSMERGTDGLAAGGLNVAWQHEDSGLYVETSFTALSTASGPSSLGGGLFGYEADLELIYPINDWLTVSAEYDVLVGGNAWRSAVPIHQVRVGLDITFSSQPLDLR